MLYHPKCMAGSTCMLTIGKSCLSVLFTPLLNNNTPRETDRLASCWEVNCSLGDIHQITWCRLSLLFWSRQFSHPARNCSSPSLSNVGCTTSTIAWGKGSFIGHECSLGEITVVTAPRACSLGAILMVRVFWGTWVVFQDSTRGFCHPNSITLIVTYSLPIEVLHRIYPWTSQSPLPSHTFTVSQLLW